MSIDTEDQAALRASVRDLLSKHSDSAAVRAAITTEIGYDAALWSKLCEQIGVAALAIPEEFDGVGAGLGEVHVVQEELGRTLTPSPMLGSAILAAQALLLSGDDDACSRLLPGVASGESTLALCWAGAAGWSTFGVEATEDALTGTASYVLDGHVADTLLVLTADGSTKWIQRPKASPADASPPWIRRERWRRSRSPVFVVGHWSGPKIWSIGSEPSF